MSPWHPFILVMQAAENFAYRSCDVCVSLLPKALAHMQEHGLDKNRYVHVPNGIDVTEWEANREELGETHRQAIDELRAQRPFLLGYVGTHGLANALDTLLDALPSCDPGLGVVMIGDGPEKERLKQKAQSLGLDGRMVFLPPVPKRQVPAALECMDALYIGWQQTPLYRFGISPNKLFDYMMSAKPIVHAIKAGNDPVAESGCGISVPPENCEALVFGLAQLLRKSPEQMREMGGHGREHVLRRHRVDFLARTMLEGVCRPRGRGGK